MKVLSLELNNFRSFERRAFEFQLGRTLIVGPHGAGKSTVFDALRWLLVGRCRGTDESGRGAAKLARRGSGDPAFSVNAMIEHREQQKVISRTFDGEKVTFTADGFTGSSDAQAAAFLTWLGTTRDVLSSVLDGDRFMKLDHSEAKDLLLSLINCDIQVSDTEVITLAECDTRHDRAFETRKVTRAAIKDKPSLAPPVNAPDDIPGTIQKILEKVAERRKERDGVVAKRAELVGERRGGSIRERERWEDEIKRLGELRERFVADGCDTAEAANAKLSEAQAKVKAIEADVTALSEPGADEKIGGKSYDQLQAAIAALDAHNPEDGCVLSRDVSCPQKSAAFAKAVKALKGDAKRVQAAVEAQGVREGKLAAAQSTLRAAHMDESTWSQRAEKIAYYDEQLDAAKAQLEKVAPVEEETPEVVTLNEQVADLDARIHKGEVMLEDQRRLLNQREAFNKREAERKALIDRLEKAEADVKTYGPDGIRKTALAAAIGTFVDTVNQGLKPFGFTLAIATSPWGITVNGIEYELLSVSEQWRVSIALQCAMAMTSGLHFTLVDQLDMLLPSVRSLMTQLLVKPGGLPMEHVILARAFEDDPDQFSGLSSQRLIDVVVIDPPNHDEAE